MATANAVRSETEIVFAHGDSAMSNPKANHAFQQKPEPLLRSSTVADVSSPSMIGGPDRCGYRIGSVLKRDLSTMA